jgi:hypothetical protein
MAHIYLASRLTDQWLGMRVYLLICSKNQKVTILLRRNINLFSISASDLTKEQWK